MPHYLVTWRIDSEADTAEEAALEAFLATQGNDSTATVYDVKDVETGLTVEVDLDVSSLILDPQSRTRQRCADCGEPGETTGHMSCQYPQDRP